MILSLLLSLGTSLMAQQAEVFAPKGIAIRGYDAVAYFTESKPVKGEKTYQHQWKGASWHFSNEANLKKFKDQPQKYAPQFGGYCAYAVAKGSTAPTDPEAWTVVDGKLYLNFSKSVRKKWLAKQAQHIKQANQNWPGVLN